MDSSSSDSDSESHNVTQVKTIKRKKHSWTLVASKLTKIQAESHELFQTHVRLYPVKHGGPGAKVSQCNIHRECTHRVRMQIDVVNGDLYEICVCGHHNVDAGFKLKEVGLNAAVTQILDPLLAAGMAPSKAAIKLKSTLREMHGGQELLHTLPSDELLTKKVANRKRSAYVCSHVLAIYDLLVSGFDLSTCIISFAETNQGGRPAKRSKALQVDTDTTGDAVLATALKGAKAIKKTILGTGTTAGKQCGLVGNYNSRTNVYLVRFMQSEEPDKIFELSEAEVARGLQAHQAMQAEAARSMAGEKKKKTD